MSLLLDALKRAEEAKRAKLSIDPASASDAKEIAQPTQRDSSSPEGIRADKPRVTSVDPQELRIEDYKETIPPKARVHATPASAPSTSGLQLQSNPALESASETGLAEAPAARMPPVTQSRLDTTRADAADSRESARNVFVAKQGTASEEGSRKKWLLPVIAAILVVVGGGGWYVWNEINRISRPSAPNMATRSATTGALAPAQPATGQLDTRQPDKGAPPPLPEPVEPPLPPLLPPPAAEAPLPALARVIPVPGPALSEREALARSLRDAPASKESPVALQLARSMEPSSVNAELVSAFTALKNADYLRAGTLYAKLVQADPLSLDAQLGMATVFARRGDSVSAVNHYRQALALDPRNGTALAGLLAMSDPRSPALEVELRTLVNRNPDSSSLRFSLGNLYASERRWVEAQQAYFEAYRLESENADHAYNLAVSLDHLKQAKLAVDYYGKALALRPKSGGQFDVSAVGRRIKELSADVKGN